MAVAGVWEEWGLGAAGPQKAAPPGAEEAEARYDPYEWYNVREWSGPRGPGSGGKGRSRRERELRTNRHLPAGHERKIAQKLRNSQAKRRRREQRGPRSTRAGRRSARASYALGPGGAGGRCVCPPSPPFPRRLNSRPDVKHLPTFQLLFPLEKGSPVQECYAMGFP
ncbi:nuclear protein 2 [Gopherus flavomarginatus]|uniref:nuclear protein 2 n=1 Tax=Gopherus flavomarginatus TaxID=286002 RepID=UPI0021CBEFAE|nr:nuclear protein 2 [Gopherus flavomarginatus]